MNTMVYDLGNEFFTQDIETVPSFGPFINYLKKGARDEQTMRREFFQFVLEKFENQPAENAIIQLDNIAKYEEQLELVYASLLPPTADENDVMWAMGTPLFPRVFYCTNAVHKMLMEKKSGKLQSAMIEQNKEVIRKQALSLIYSFILEKLYNFKSILRNEMIRSFIDPETGLSKYYKIHIDTRFIDVHVKGDLPELNFDVFQPHFQDDAGLEMLEKTLPLSLFSAEGFSIITLIDATEYYTIENIKNSLLNREADEDYSWYDNVIQSLKTLVGNSAIEFGLLPMLKVNNKLIFNDENCLDSVLIGNARAFGVAESTYLSMAENYSANPKLYFFKTITKEDEERQLFLKILKLNGIQSYAMVPVFYNQHLAGVLEVHSKKEHLLDERVLARLEPAIPLLAQLLQNQIDEFSNRIDLVIKEKFTSVQPAVQWKFNEVSWHYLRDKHLKKTKAEIEPIYFKDVFPLYGAIDIRNSTVARNYALRRDLQNQFRFLSETLTALKQRINLSLLDEKIFKCKKWERTVADFLTTSDELKLNDFFDREINTFLSYFKDNHPETLPIVNRYFEAIDEQQGIVYENRRKLESSMQLINAAVNNYLEMFKVELQNAYPCYFEKFRTDGIEYDIYIGQSIAPENPFNLLYLNNLRLWQLTSMAAIAKLTHALLPQMPEQLQTTQLIFAHGSPIDISFRNDERRFDVEGAYNIRYQVIKKRIDKVHIKDSQERLTQPAKIALVYFNRSDAEEYIKYINYLREQHVLADDMEQLELEELQGINGLQALRVGVNLD